MVGKFLVIVTCCTVGNSWHSKNGKNSKHHNYNIIIIIIINRNNGIKEQYTIMLN